MSWSSKSVQKQRRTLWFTEFACQFAWVSAVWGRPTLKDRLRDDKQGHIRWTITALSLNQFLTIKTSNQNWECRLSNSAWIVTVLIMLHALNCSLLNHALFLPVALATNKGVRTIARLSLKILFRMMCIVCSYNSSMYC